MTYRSCAVPMCRNTSNKCPDKLFIRVPNSNKCLKRRKQWLMLARRDPNLTSNKTIIYFCEDHFDLPNDMENYMQYSIMGSVGIIRMKPDCLPSKFQCQPDSTAPPLSQVAARKRQHKDIIQELLASEETKKPASEMTCNTDYNGHNKSYVHKIEIEVEPLESIYFQNVEAVDENARVKEEPVVKEENLEYYNEYDLPHRNGYNLEIKKEPLDIHVNLQENEIVETRYEPQSCKEEAQDPSRDNGSKCSTQNGKYTRRGSTCNVCDLYFENRENLESHIRSCAMSYSCKICDEQFNKLSLLRTHILTHIGATAYTCGVCSKSFARRVDLKSHERTHTGEKPYTCDFCRKTFNHLSNLRRHKKAHFS